MEIVFLGTGGGRINLIKQVRATGGFRINSSSANIHVDPGPGALLKTHEFKQDALGLDAIIISHNHVDHSGDGQVMIEAMSHYALKKRGILIGSKYSLVGNEVGDRVISKYHQKLAEQIYVAKYEDIKKFATGKGEFEIEIKKAKHDEPSCFGFVLNIEEKKIGYSSDTEYFKGIEKEYDGCDYIIFNCLKPRSDGIPDHLKTTDIIKILNDMDKKPTKVMLTHLGLKMIRANPKIEAERVEQETGVKTIAAEDGMTIKID